jgi:hypothetical protein
MRIYTMPRDLERLQADILAEARPEMALKACATPGIFSRIWASFKSCPRPDGCCAGCGQPSNCEFCDECKAW